MLLPSNTDEALEATKAVLVDRIFGEAGKELVIEDFLEGEEVSLLAFCDGRVSVCMPAAQVWVFQPCNNVYVCVPSILYLIAQSDSFLSQ